MVSQINDFTANHHELIILNLSHDLDTDASGKFYPTLDQGQYNQLLQLLSGINHLYIAPNAAQADLTKIKINNFIGNGHASVIVIAQPSGSGISLGSYANRGFYPEDKFPTYNEYSDTDDFDAMAHNQLQKMTEQRKDGKYFLLSWTLTLSKASSALGGSIINLASEANQQLTNILFKKDVIKSNQFPNIVYTDNIGGGSPYMETLPTQTTAVISAAINQKLSMKSK